MKIENFKPFIGQHCETTATGTLLNQIDIKLSEPMLFGIGEGIGFIFWNMKMMDFPFIGGRVKPDVLTENICRNLNLKIDIKETSSIKKAWLNVQSELDRGKTVGLKLDCYHLEYFNTKIHFAGHYAAIYGYDDTYAYLIDTDQQGGAVKTTLQNLELARNEKGSMSSKNKSFTIGKTDTKINLQSAVKTAIYNNAVTYLNPPIKNFTYKGIKKTATEIKNWFNTSKNIKEEFQLSAVLMEKAGTGGSLFRNLYRDFLKESAELLKSESIKQVQNDFVDIALHWKQIAELFHKIGETQNEKYLNEASNIFLLLSDKEKEAFEKLKVACS